MTTDRTILDPRNDVALHEDLVTPMHHHIPGQDFLLAHDPETGAVRRVTPHQAANLVQERAAMPGVHEVEPAPGTRSLSRRLFVRAGTMGAGALAMASAAPRMSFAASPAGARGDLLVVIFLRGAFDGLSAAVPVNDRAYYTARPDIAVRAEDTVALNTQFGLNRHLSGLTGLWNAGQVAVVVGSGLPQVTRSHFQDMVSCEVAAPANQRSGWVGRLLAARSSSTGTFRAISMGSKVAMSLTTTAFNSVAMSSVAEFDLYGWGEAKVPLMRNVDAMFTRAGGRSGEQAHLTLAAIDRLASVRSTTYTPAGGAAYPDTDFGRGLRDIAQMAKSGVGLEAATVDSNGWDMHVDLGSASTGDGWFSRQAREFAGALSAFATDLGDRWNSTTVVAMSEFGRRVSQNGALGVDHGHGNTLWVLGGGIRGGVYGTQPDLTASNLTMGDVPVTTDYRQVLAEVVTGRLGVNDLATVFPGFTPGARLGIVR